MVCLFVYIMDRHLFVLLFTLNYLYFVYPHEYFEADGVFDNVPGIVGVPENGTAVFVWETSISLDGRQIVLYHGHYGVFIRTEIMPLIVAEEYKHRADLTVNNQSVRLLVRDVSEEDTLKNFTLLIKFSNNLSISSAVLYLYRAPTRPNIIVSESSQSTGRSTVIKCRSRSQSLPALYRQNLLYLWSANGHQISDSDQYMLSGRGGRRLTIRETNGRSINVTCTVTEEGSPYRVSNHVTINVGGRNGPQREGKTKDLVEQNTSNDLHREGDRDGSRSQTVIRFYEIRGTILGVAEVFGITAAVVFCVSLILISSVMLWRRHRYAVPIHPQTVPDDIRPRKSSHQLLIT